VYYSTVQIANSHSIAFHPDAKKKRTPSVVKCASVLRIFWACVRLYVGVCAFVCLCVRVSKHVSSALQLDDKDRQ